MPRFTDQDPGAYYWYERQGFYTLKEGLYWSQLNDGIEKYRYVKELARKIPEIFKKNMEGKAANG